VSRHVGYLQQFPFLEMLGAISVEEDEPSEEQHQDLQPHSLWKKNLSLKYVLNMAPLLYVRK
jgi:hypothetical protein